MSYRPPRARLVADGGGGGGPSRPPPAPTGRALGVTARAGRPGSDAELRGCSPRVCGPALLPPRGVRVASRRPRPSTSSPATHCLCCCLSRARARAPAARQRLNVTCPPAPRPWPCIPFLRSGGRSERGGSAHHRSNQLRRHVSCARVGRSRDPGTLMLVSRPWHARMHDN
jgi:hypothetical protein